MRFENAAQALCVDLDGPFRRVQPRHDPLEGDGLSVCLQQQLRKTGELSPHDMLNAVDLDERPLRVYLNHFTSLCVWYWFFALIAIDRRPTPSRVGTIRFWPPPETPLGRTNLNFIVEHDHRSRASLCSDV